MDTVKGIVFGLVDFLAVLLISIILGLIIRAGLWWLFGDEVAMPVMTLAVLVITGITLFTDDRRSTQALVIGGIGIYIISWFVEFDFYVMSGDIALYLVSVVVFCSGYARAMARKVS